MTAIIPTRRCAGAKHQLHAASPSEFWCSDECMKRWYLDQLAAGPRASSAAAEPSKLQVKPASKCTVPIEAIIAMHLQEPATLVRERPFEPEPDEMYLAAADAPTKRPTWLALLLRPLLWRSR